MRSFFRFWLLPMLLAPFFLTPTFGINESGVAVLVGADISGVKPGFEVSGYFFGIGVFYNYYDTMDYIQSSKPYEFDNAIYSYTVKGTRDVFGVRWDLYNWLSGAAPNSNISSFYIGFGRNTIKGKMEISKITATNDIVSAETFDVSSEFTLDSYMFGLFAKTVSRLGMDLRIRYDTASIPMIDENTKKKRSGKTIPYTNVFPEILIGWSF